MLSSIKIILQHAGLLFVLFSFCACEETAQIRPGMTIRSSMTFPEDTIYFDQLSTINIEGENIIVDFNHSVLIGTRNPYQPETFKGLAISIQYGSNITIKNVNIHGFETAILAEGVDDLKIENSDFSYNSRRKTISEMAAPFAVLRDADDGYWEERLKPGVAVYLNNCDRSILKNLRITESQNGVIISDCEDAMIYNNEIQFNSGVGIGLFYADRNKILHNHLDWNVNTNDPLAISGGILLFENSSENEINYNSITHCGSGSLFFDDANNEETLGGNFSNRILQNDFSYTPKYEMIHTFESGNHFERNIKEGCALTIVEEEFSSDQFTPPLSDGINPFLPSEILQGCQYILTNEYGPYNFKYPSLWLRDVDASGKYTFAIFGPPGNWKAVGGEGFKTMSQKRGTIPATLVLQSVESPEQLSVKLEYLGPGFFDAFGQWQKKGKSLILEWKGTK